MSFRPVFLLTVIISEIHGEICFYRFESARRGVRMESDQRKSIPKWLTYINVGVQVNKKNKLKKKIIKAHARFTETQY